MPFAVVTFGPADEPIDDVRRITNHSTGELGTLLVEKLRAAGVRVAAFCGRMATIAPPDTTIRFSSNTSLAAALDRLGDMPDVFLHAAALADFHVVRAADTPRKLASDQAITLTLTPALKLLPTLRQRFPKARIAGWKYEADGDLTTALARGRRQIAANATDLCVVNGPAAGEGFHVLTSADDTTPIHLPSKPALATWLTAWTLRPMPS